MYRLHQTCCALTRFYEAGGGDNDKNDDSNNDDLIAEQKYYLKESLRLIESYTLQLSKLPAAARKQEDPTTNINMK